MTLPAVWFAIVAAMLAVYVVLDGFDLGAGLLTRFVARDDRERRQVMRAIGPYWDGNEVWLLAAGGALVAAFPSLYARAFSGFYLPLMLVLWLLALRGVSIEFRNKAENAVWRPFWDTVFMGSSGLLALVFGVAIGNVVRGVPIDAEGRFFLPLFASGALTGLSEGALDLYTIGAGLLSLAALAWHGALFLALKAEGSVGERARRLATRLSLAVAALTAAVTAATLFVQPRIAASLEARPWGAAFSLLAVGGLFASFLASRRGRFGRAFAGSSAYLAGMLASVAFGLYPAVLPSRPFPERTLSVEAAAAAPYGLGVALYWWIPGMVLAAIYFVLVYRRLRGRVPLDEGEAH